MTVYYTICFLSFFAMMIALINHKFGKVQTTIAITAGAMVLSLLILILGHAGLFKLDKFAQSTIGQVDFDDFLLKGILGFLLFAGGLGIKLPNFRDQKWEITILAFGSTLFSTFFIGVALHFVANLMGMHIDFIYCVLFGALISPTDPIAVLAIVKKLNAPQRISTQIEGESLFNDGIGLVIFVTVFTIAFGDVEPTIGSVAELFLVEAVGGVLYGALLGLFFHYLISSTDDHSMELLLMIGVPTTGYIVADLIGVSGPLAMVIASIMIGNWTRYTGFSRESIEHMDNFWELVDEYLNGILFLLIGFSMLLFEFNAGDLLMGLIAIPLVLLSRFLSVWLPYQGFKRFRAYNPWSVKILTWGGLRGGLALAMALSIPPGRYYIYGTETDIQEVIMIMTYAVVVFSILIQGSTITPMINRAKAMQELMDEQEPISRIQMGPNGIPKLRTILPNKKEMLKKKAKQRREARKAQTSQTNNSEPEQGDDTKMQ